MNSRDRFNEVITARWNAHKYIPGMTWRDTAHELLGLYLGLGITDGLAADRELMADAIDLHYIARMYSNQESDELRSKVEAYVEGLWAAGNMVEEARVWWMIVGELGGLDTGLTYGRFERLHDDLRTLRLIAVHRAKGLER